MGVCIALALALSMSLVSCSDKATQSKLTKPTYKIAFISQQDGSYGIFTMNNDGSSQKRLTIDGGINPFISWSPDGSRIAYTSLRPPHNNLYEIYVVLANGAFPTRLTTSSHLMGEVGACPVWSPDGSKLAFRSYRDGNSEVYIMNADGSNQVNVTHDPNHDYEPVWRPDGMGITFLSAVDDTTNPGIRAYWSWFVGTDGARREIIYGAWSDSMSSFYWFPTGSTFGLVCFSYPGRQSSTFVCDVIVQGRNCYGKSIFHDSNKVEYAAWSPDGSKLSFVSNAEGRRNIYSVNTRGDNESPKRLTNSLTGEGATSPAWSPDGAELVFAADWTGDAEIYIMNADGTNMRRLTTSSGSGYPVCALSQY